MKILFLGRDCKVGGGTTFRFRASRGLIERGHQISLMAQGGPMAARFTQLGVRHFKVPPSPLNRLKLIQVLRRENLDVVHACKATEGDDVAFALRFVPRRPRFVVSIHSVLPDYVQGNRCLRECDDLIAFDRSALARLRKIEFLGEREIHLVRRPIEQRDKPATPAAPPRVVMVSRLSKRKGWPALAAIEAVAALQNEWPGLSLSIVGDGDMKAEIERRAGEINARFGRPLVTLAGMMIDPFPAMADAAAVIGTAYVAFEALFHEIPVVAAGLQPFGVVTLDNLEAAIDCNFGDAAPGPGMVVSPRSISPEWFSDGLRQVLALTSTPEGRAHFARLRQHLKERHSLERVASHLEAIYQHR